MTRNTTKLSPGEVARKAFSQCHHPLTLTDWNAIAAAAISAEREDVSEDEYQHCRRLVVDQRWDENEAIAILLRERAAAKAECHAKHTAERSEDAREIERLKAELSSEKLGHTVDRLGAEALLAQLCEARTERAGLESQLAAAKEELEEATHFASYKVNSELQAELSILRARVAELEVHRG